MTIWNTLKRMTNQKTCQPLCKSLAAHFRFCNKAGSAVSDACEVVTSAYETLVDNDEVLDTFQDFVAVRKRPFLCVVSNLRGWKKCGQVNHKDMDVMFFSAILIMKDSLRGRLHITNIDLSEEFDKGDLILMDPSVFHSVTEYAREDKRKFVVFIC